MSTPPRRPFSQLNENTSSHHHEDTARNSDGTKQKRRTGVTCDYSGTARGGKCNQLAVKGTTRCAFHPVLRFPDDGSGSPVPALPAAEEARPAQHQENQSLPLSAPSSGRPTFSSSGLSSDARRRLSSPLVQPRSTAPPARALLASTDSTNPTEPTPHAPIRSRRADVASSTDSTNQTEPTPHMGVRGTDAAHDARRWSVRPRWVVEIALFAIPPCTEWGCTTCDPSPSHGSSTGWVPLAFATLFILFHHQMVDPEWFVRMTPRKMCALGYRCASVFAFGAYHGVARLHTANLVTIIGLLQLWHLRKYRHTNIAVVCVFISAMMMVLWALPAKCEYPV